VNFEEADCNIIKRNKPLNPNDLKDAEIISKMLEESDEDEEDENFELYVSDDEEIDETLPDDDLPDENLDSIPFTQKKIVWTTEIANYRKNINSHISLNTIEFKLEAKREIKIFIKKPHSINCRIICR